MAEFYVTNSLNYNKTVKFNITFRYYVIKGVKGEYFWILEIGTTYPDKNGNAIPSKQINLISLDNVDDVIEQGVSDLCKLIDWSPFVQDKEPPFVDYVWPVGPNSSIGSNINIILKEWLPSAGIDLSNLKIILNNGTVDFDITSEVNIEGDPYEYTLTWVPAIRVYDTYD